MSTRTRIATLSLLIAAGAAWSCKPKDTKAQALKFNQAIVDQNKKMAKQSGEFVEQLKAYYKGKAGAADKLQKALDRMLDKLKSIRSSTKSLDRPSSKVAKKLYKAYLSFLDDQEKLIKDDLGKVVKLAKTNRKPQKVVRQIAKLLKDVGKKEQSSLKNLKRVQREYASHYGITLI